MASVANLAFVYVCRKFLCSSGVLAGCVLGSVIVRGLFFGLCLVWFLGDLMVF